MCPNVYRITPVRVLVGFTFLFHPIHEWTRPCRQTYTVRWWSSRLCLCYCSADINWNAVNIKIEAYTGYEPTSYTYIEFVTSAAFHSVQFNSCFWRQLYRVMTFWWCPRFQNKVKSVGLGLLEPLVEYDLFLTGLNSVYKPSHKAVQLAPDNVKFYVEPFTLLTTACNRIILLSTNTSLI